MESRIEYREYVLAGARANVFNRILERKNRYNEKPYFQGKKRVRKAPKYKLQPRYRLEVRLLTELESHAVRILYPTATKVVKIIDWNRHKRYLSPQHLLASFTRTIDYHPVYVDRSMGVSGDITIITIIFE